MGCADLARMVNNGDGVLLEVAEELGQISSVGSRGMLADVPPS